MRSVNNNKRSSGPIFATLVWILIVSGVSAEAQSEKDDVFATVGATVVTVDDYRLALREGMRKKFYHGAVPADTLAAFQREVGEQLVVDALLLQEAERRGIAVEQELVDSRLKQLEERYQSRPDWPELRASVMARFRQQLEKQSLLAQLDAQLRQVGPPSEAEIRRYYEDNPEKFTEPEQVRLSLILLSVDPSAPVSAWDAATAEAESLVKRLRAGAEFSELARLHSADPSAEKGGDMGRIHQGTLSASVEATIAALSPGEVSDPVRLLEGVAVFRLEERFPQRLRNFDSVRERASLLWEREQRQRVREQLIARLRETTPIDVREEYYLSTGAPVPEPR